jgi:nucleotide-binding universal stress UspA family protein
MEVTFRSILVPVDGSMQSRISQEMAIFLSKLFTSQVTVMHVVSSELPELAGKTYSSREDIVPVNQATMQFPRAIEITRPRENIFPDEVINELTNRLREDGQTLLNQSVAVFTASGLAPNHKSVEATDIAEAIIEEADKGKYDLVVMGNSSEELLPLDLHLGSVARKVALSVKASTLIVRKKTEVEKILVPVDGSIKEERSLRKAKTIAKAANASIVLLHVQEKLLLRLRPEITQVGIAILERAAKLLDGVEVEKKLLPGDPAHFIIQTAEQVGADLIVMGSGGLSLPHRLFLGSVTDHVLHHATVPVLLVKQTASSG